MPMVMSANRERFDWEARNDAETLQRAEMIKADKERLAKATACLREGIAESKSALRAMKGRGLETFVDNKRGRRNKATVSPLNPVR